MYDVETFEQHTGHRERAQDLDGGHWLCMVEVDGTGLLRFAFTAVAGS